MEMWFRCDASVWSVRSESEEWILQEWRHEWRRAEGE